MKKKMGVKQPQALLGVHIIACNITNKMGVKRNDLGVKRPVIVSTAERLHVG